MCKRCFFFNVKEVHFLLHNVHLDSWKTGDGYVSKFAEDGDTEPIYRSQIEYVTNFISDLIEYRFVITPLPNYQTKNQK